MEVMHAGFVMWLHDFIVNNYEVFIWIIILAIIVRLLYVKTYMSRFFIIILGFVLSILILRLISKEWFESFVEFWKYGKR